MPARPGAERLAVGIASGFGASLKGPGHAHHNAMRAVRFGEHLDQSGRARLQHAVR